MNFTWQYYRMIENNISSKRIIKSLNKRSVRIGAAPTWDHKRYGGSQRMIFQAGD